MKFIEENKEKFTQLDLEDVQVREKLKHATSKAKKLEKQLHKDKDKVGAGTRVWLPVLVDGSALWPKTMLKSVCIC